jgi:4,5-dihydroxyphthalate decarboxylase
MRRDRYEAHPWIAMNLYSAFDEAKQRSVARASDITASSFRFRALRVYVNE